MADINYDRVLAQTQLDTTFEANTDGDASAEDIRQEFKDAYESQANLASDNTFTKRNTFHGPVRITQGSDLTIASGAITVTHSHHRVDTQGGASTDDLDTISGGTTGQILIIRSVSGARDTTLVETGNLKLNGSFTLTVVADQIVLIYDGTNWNELTRSNNA